MNKILFLGADLCSRGSERQMVNVACQLKKSGYDVSFVCYHTNNFYEHILIDNGIPVNWLKLNNYVKRVFAIRKYIRKGGYCAVISFLSTDNFLNCFAAIGKHTWKVITGERSSKETALTSNRGKIFAWFQRFSDDIVCNSENALRMWLHHYPQYRSKLKVIYNNVHLPEIDSYYSCRKDCKTHIIIAGAYSYVKDPLSLIKAVAMLQPEEVDKIVIEWYGKKGINEESRRVLAECEELIGTNCLGGIIHLWDATNDIANKMNEADVVALFSKWEGLPNAICEGMALGKPIIMTRISDYSKLVDTTNGFLCDVNSPESIHNALKAIISLTDKQIMEMGKASKEKVNHLFSDTLITEQWLNIIA